MQALEETAVERVRAFLLDRIGGLKSAAGGGGASSHSAAAGNAAVRRQGLLPFQAYPSFLQAAAPAAYAAVRQRYVEDHRAHLATAMKAYISGLAAAVPRKERPALVTVAELAGGGFNARLGSIFLPRAPPPPAP